MEDRLVMHGAAEQGMWMAHHCRMRGAGRAYIEEGLKSPRRSIEEKGADCFVFSRHVCCLPRRDN